MNKNITRILLVLMSIVTGITAASGQSNDPSRLRCLSYTWSGNMQMGSAQRLSAELLYEGDVESDDSYSHPLVLVVNGKMYDSDTTSELFSCPLQGVHAGKARIVVLYVVMDSPENSWNLYADATCQHLLASGTLTLGEWQPQPLTATLELSKKNMGESGRDIVFGTTAKGLLHVKNEGHAPFFDGFLARLSTSDGTMVAEKRAFFLQGGCEPGSALDRVFSFEGMETGRQYGLTFFYRGNGEWHELYNTTVEGTPDNFYLRADNSAYPVIVGEDGYYKVPSDAALVFLENIKDSKLTIDRSDASPNCMYRIWTPEGWKGWMSEENAAALGLQEYPAGLGEVNVSNGRWLECVRMTDGFDFLPVYSECDDYIATMGFGSDATYTRKVDGKHRYEVLSVPFNFDKVTVFDAEGNVITDNPAILDYKGSDGDLLVFDEAPKEKVFGSCGEKDGWYRLVPYLVSMPTGAASFTVECTELTNHLAVDIELTAYEGDNCAFHASLRHCEVDNSYMLNADGTAFIHVEKGMAEPFRGYFVTKDGAQYDRLVINGETAGVREVDVFTCQGRVAAYTLDGKRVGTVMVDGARVNTSDLPSGIYIVRRGGMSRKVIVR